MARYVALLRGINLGARRRVAMAELRSALERAGFEDVRTLLQSGNVGVTSAQRAPAVRAAIERVLAEELGVETDAIVRTRAELEAVVAGNPLRDVATDGKRLQVHFLSGKPKAAAVRALEAADLEPERLAVRGRELYAWYADGIQRSPLDRLISRTDLGVAATARNWNTVGKLLDLAA